uniref:Uncharacterized protein n=1 Tax=viral metagenome TaxID=1070528 RepID=A0A6C0DI64_9ZZZZ
MQSVEDILYTKLLDTKLVLRDTQEHFKTYSAKDLVNLIRSALHNKRKNPEGIKLLYDLEKCITDLRHLMEEERLKNLMN